MLLIIEFNDYITSLLTVVLKWVLGTTVISFLELRQEGLLFSNIATPLSLDDPFHMGWVIFMLFIDTIIYMLLYW